MLKNAQTAARLRFELEKAKIALSTEQSSPVVFAAGGKDVRFELTRREVETAVAPIIERCRGPIRIALEEAGLSPNEVFHVVLVGGPTMMPAVRQMVMEEFQTNAKVVQELRAIDDHGFPVHPMEAVAQGAVLGTVGRITPHGYGVLLSDQYYEFLPRRQRYPCDGMLGFTRSGHRRSVDFGVVRQAVDPTTHREEYLLLGTFNFDYCAQPGLTELAMEWEYTDNGLLNFHVSQPSTALHLPLFDVSRLEGKKIRKPVRPISLSNPESGYFPPVCEQPLETWTQDELERAIQVGSELLKLAEERGSEATRAQAEKIRRVSHELTAWIDDALEPLEHRAPQIRDLNRALLNVLLVDRIVTRSGGCELNARLAVMRRCQFLGSSSIHHFVEVGDYFAALNVTREARKLDIDVAAAKLARRYPSEASFISTIAGVLTHAPSREVYLRVCCLRDTVQRQLQSQHGEAVAKTIPNLKRRVWVECCELFQIDLDSSFPQIGPRGLSSLVGQGAAWVVESILHASVVPIRLTDSEVKEGTATREIWHADCPKCRSSQLVSCRRRQPLSHPDEDLDATGPGRVIPCDHFEPSDYDYRVANCRKCRSRGAEPSEYEGTYRFTISGKPRPGTVVAGSSLSSRRTILAVVDKITISRPVPTLRRFHQLQQAGEDVTLDEASRRMSRTGATDSSSADNSEPELLPAIPSILILLVAVLFLAFGPKDKKKTNSEVRRPDRREWLTSLIETSEGNRADDDLLKEESTSNPYRAQNPSSTLGLEMAVHLVETMSGDRSDDAGARAHLAKGYVALGHRYLQEDLDDRAIEMHQKAIDLLTTLLAEDPDQFECYRLLARAHNGMGNALRKSGQMEIAQQHVTTALETIDELRQRATAETDCDLAYAIMQLHLAQIMLRREPSEQVLELLAAARPQLELAVENSPADEQLKKYLEQIGRIESRLRSQHTTATAND